MKQHKLINTRKHFFEQSPSAYALKLREKIENRKGQLKLTQKEKNFSIFNINKCGALMKHQSLHKMPLLFW